MALPPRPDALPRLPRPPAPPRAPRPPAVRTGVSRTTPRTAVSGVSTGIVGGIGAARNLTPPPPPVPTAPPAPASATAVTDSTSYGHQARIDAIRDRINTLNDFFNPQREIAAVNARNALVDNQWFDLVNQNPSTDGGSTRFDLYGVGEGQQQRDQVMGSAGNFNARGALFSSAARRARQEIIRRITTQRQRMLEAAASAQRQSIAEQIGRDIDLQNDLRTASADYEDWKAAQGGRA